jgi:CRP-like cAMP-binding protein
MAKTEKIAPEAGGLANCEFFNGMSAELRLELETRRNCFFVPANTYIFHEGERARPLSVVWGEVEAIVSGVGGREFSVYQKSGAFLLGLHAAMCDGMNNASARTLTRCAVDCFSAAEWRTLAAGNAEFARAVALELARSGMEFERHVRENLLDGPIAMRLARLLLKEESVVATHESLGNRLGSSRETVSRVLAGWQKDGLVLARKTVGGASAGIAVLDRERLGKIIA